METLMEFYSVLHLLPIKPPVSFQYYKKKNLNNYFMNKAPPIPEFTIYIFWDYVLLGA